MRISLNLFFISILLYGCASSVKNNSMNINFKFYNHPALYDNNTIIFSVSSNKKFYLLNSFEYNKNRFVTIGFDNKLRKITESHFSIYKDGIRLDNIKLYNYYQGYPEAIKLTSIHTNKIPWIITNGSQYTITLQGRGIYPDYYFNALWKEERKYIFSGITNIKNGTNSISVYCVITRVKLTAYNDRDIPMFKTKWITKKFYKLKEGLIYWEKKERKRRIFAIRLKSVKNKVFENKRNKIPYNGVSN